jgi:hypothetical protein
MEKRLCAEWCTIILSAGGRTVRFEFPRSYGSQPSDPNRRLKLL